MSAPNKYAQLAVDAGFYADNFSPRKCFKCNSMSIIESPVDYYGGILLEFSYHCADCGAELGYWVAGSCNSDYAEYVGELINRGEYE